MANQSRVGDTGAGTCLSHETPVPYTTTFTNIGSAATVFVNGRNAAIVGTVGIATCGHNTTALTGSATVFIEGRPAHRVGDTGANGGPYQAVSGSDNVIIG